MRVIIPAAGLGERWAMYGGIRKHQAKVAKEPILARQIRLWNAVGVRPLVLVHPDYPYDYQDADYEAVDPGGSSIGKITSSRPWWSDTEDTVISFGDVYYTYPGFEQLLPPRGEWTVFGRLHRYQYGAKGRSFFGLRFRPADAPEVEAIAAEVERLDNAGELVPSHGRLGVFYRIGTGQSPIARLLADRGHLVTIDDITDDIDKPEHLKLLRRAVKQCG